MFIDLWQKKTQFDGVGVEVGSGGKGEGGVCVIVTVWLPLKNVKVGRGGDLLQKWIFVCFCGFILSEC